jgi:oligoendopeptidase F
MPVALEWAGIPHFYLNFYVYQYATGTAVANVLSRRILEEGESTVALYRNFLGKGKSQSAIDLLKEVGVDMTSSEPIEEACLIFGDLVTRMEQVANVMK